MAAKRSKTVTTEIMGINVTVDPEVFDNLELLEVLDEINDGNVLKLAKAFKLVFGEQWDYIREHLKDERGVVTASAASEFFATAMNSLGDSKN